jgi:sulfate transport system ATP-binding protein
VDRAPEGARDDALAFVRPHDIEILREAVTGGLVARIQHVQAIGPLVRVEVDHQGEIFEVELTRERHEQLALQDGETVWIRPRSLRVFQGEQLLAAQHFELGAGI